MLKTISAALLAASVIVAPALAAETGKTEPGKTTTQAPVIKADQTQSKAAVKSTAKSAKADVKSKAMNANAMVGPEHTKHVRSHRHHKMTAAASSSTKAPSAMAQPSAGAKSTEPVTTGKAKSTY
jgi:hypothetical protein